MNRIIVQAYKSWFMGICLLSILVLTSIPFYWKGMRPISSAIHAQEEPSQSLPENQPVANTSQQVYLPFVQNGRLFSSTQDLPIWSHDKTPAPHEVNLFRYRFSLPEDLNHASLQIFADTRYEVWIDGLWIGRGPARFSLRTREYDVYDLSTLKRGNHLIAVLVQWAPNNRRSESTTPYLKAHIEGKNSKGKIIEAATGTQWKSILSDAWKPDSAPVHNWGLIGPTELFDFRRLPENWKSWEYNDEGWPNAVSKDLSRIDFHPLIIPRLTNFDYELGENDNFDVLSMQTIDPNTISYLPRSIPFLKEAPVSLSVLDAGSLSPGWKIGELQPGYPLQDIEFVADGRTTFKIEILSSKGLPEGKEVLIDGSPLQWRKSSPLRPDVYTSEPNVGNGIHVLRFPNVPQNGFAFAIYPQGITFDKFPFQQGRHAGHRLLLAEPVSNSGVVKLNNSEGQAIDLTINNPPAYVVLDLGRTILGRLTAEIKGAPGTIVDIGWDERLLPGTRRPLPYPGSLHNQWNQVDSWVLDGDTNQLGTIDVRAGRYILIAVWGKETVQIRNLNVYEERIPLKQNGFFSSGDPVLDEVWQLGADTLYSNMSDAYADPWRERGQWWGDAFVTDHSNQVVFGNADLLRRGLIFMAEAFTNGKPNALAPNGAGHHMLDYGMLWVQSLADYVERTGDKNLLVQVYPEVAQFIAYLQTFKSDDTGLMNIPDGNWWQTTYIDTIGSASRNGQSTAVNSLYFGTLTDAAYLAETAGYPKAATQWKSEAEAIKLSVNKYLFRPAEHRYISSIRNGKDVPASVHAQAWPLAYGLVPSQEITPVASSLLDLISMQPDSPDVEVYGTFWVLEALGKAGMVEEGIDLIKVYYGHLLDSGATTTWEIYNSNKFFTQSLSHGWGSSPTWFLSTYLLGVRQTSENTWIVQPALEGVEMASGGLPLPGGNLKVTWQTEGCTHYQIDISSPTETNGQVILPEAEGMVVNLDGMIIWQKSSPSTNSVNLSQEGISVQVKGGDHMLSVDTRCLNEKLP